METLEGYPLCLICNSSLVTASDQEEEKIKLEPETCFDENNDKQSVLIFVLCTVLEIPQSELLQLKEKLTDHSLLYACYCEPCTKLIYSAKHIYTQILEITQKFREVQKQIVEHISHNSTVKNLNHDHDGVTAMLDFFKIFLDKHNFNGFGYPFVVEKISTNSLSFLSSPRSTECKEEFDLNLESSAENQVIKEEPFSEDEEFQISDHDDNSSNDDYHQSRNSTTTTPASEDEEEKSESEPDSESDFELPKKIPKRKPPTPPPSQVNKVKTKVNRKSKSTSSSEHPQKVKGIPGLNNKKSKFTLLYPNYPHKRVLNPTTKKFHCCEPSCSKSYSKKETLERHIITVHLQDNFYKCSEPSCGKSYASQEIFKDHLSWHKGIPRWKCEEKVKVTTTTPDGDQETLECPEAYFSRRKLNRHVQQVHLKDKPFICEICGKILSCPDYLSTHKYAHHKDKLKKKSGTETETTSGLPKDYICNYCGMGFRIKLGLQVHINQLHEKTVGKFACQFCDYKFVGKILLKQHLWAKHDKFSLEGYQPPAKKYLRLSERRYQCDVRGCRKLFVKEETYKKHMEEKHGGGGGGDVEGKKGTRTVVDYDFKCELCGKGFHDRCKLDYHLERHRNKESKPFSCEICGNRFATMAYLKMHRWNIHKIPVEKARKNK